MSKSVLKERLKRRITIMVVPHNESRVFQVKIPVIAAVCLLIISLSVVFYSVYVVKLNIDYRIAQQNVESLKSKVTVLNEEFAKIRDKMVEFTAQEKKLKGMLGYKNKKSLIEEKGLGGSSKAEQNTLENMFSSEVKKEDVKNTLSNMIAEIDLREQSFKEVEKHISGLKSIWVATPKGLPIKGYVTSKFGFRKIILERMGSADGAKDWHAGIDVANKIGTKIKATADGKVVFAGRMGGYGILVILDHGYGFTTRYGHCKEILVKKWQEVKSGQEIALIGMTGNTTGPHVHYEVRRYGKELNPEKIDSYIYER